MYSTYDSETGEFTQVYDLEKCLQSIRIRNRDNEERIKYLEEENKRLKEEYSKDEEIQNMQQKLNAIQKDLWRGFPISEDEEKAIEEWKKEHFAKVHGLKTADDRMRAGGCIGGSWMYEFTPTSIGVSGCIKCNSCGEKFEFQEIG